VKIKFLADENLRRAVVLGVRRHEPSVSFLQAFEVGASGASDPAVLQIAANEGCILVSHDFKTIPQHFHDFVRSQISPGVFLIPQRLALSIAIDELVMLWVASDAKEWVNQLCYLPL
jgi:Domain of unknown function (DUF5615)